MGVVKIEDRLNKDDPAASKAVSPPLLPYGAATLGGFKGEVPGGMTRREWERQQAETSKQLRKR